MHEETNLWEKAFDLAGSVVCRGFVGLAFKHHPLNKKYVLTAAFAGTAIGIASHHHFCEVSRPDDQTVAAAPVLTAD